MAEALLQVRDLRKYIPVRRRLGGARVAVRALDGVNLTVQEGETHGLVGESGCGKTTLARTVLRLVPPTEGKVLFRGIDLVTLSDQALRRIRREMQIVFQDPFSSLNPRMPVGKILAEPLAIHTVLKRREQRARVTALLERVGLDASHLARYPHQFSGGQRQRVGIARALVLDPSLVILDEPISALDVSIQAQIVNLLAELRRDLGLTYLFIAHDLAMVRQVADRVSVMYLGKIMETGSREDIFERPAHPYTRALLMAIPVPDPVRERTRSRLILTGEVPSPVDPPSGCVFRTRCPKAQPLCAQETPALVDRGQGHPVACHFPEIGPLA